MWILTLSEEPTCCHTQRTASKEEPPGAPCWDPVLPSGQLEVCDGGGVEGGSVCVCDAGNSEEQEPEHAKINQILSV